MEVDVKKNGTIYSGEKPGFAYFTSCLERKKNLSSFNRSACNFILNFITVQTFLCK